MKAVLQRLLNTIRYVIMEYLKKHTDEELERMSEDNYSNYEEALCDLTRKLGLNCYSLNEMEDELLSIIECVKKPKRKLGSKFNAVSKAKKNSVYDVYKPIEKCRKAIIDIIQSYIGDGELRFSKRISTIADFDERFTFNVIRVQMFSDLFDECEPEQALSCEMLDEFDGEYVKLANLPLKTLLEIVELIRNDKAVLYSRKECIIDYQGTEYLKDTILASGLLEDGIL